MAKILNQKIPKGVTVSVMPRTLRGASRRTIRIGENVLIDEKFTRNLFNMHEQLNAQQGRLATDFYRELLDPVSGRKLGTLHLVLTDWDHGVLYLERVNAAPKRLAAENTHGSQEPGTISALSQQFMSFTIRDVF